MASFRAKSLLKPYFFKTICFFIGIFSMPTFSHAANVALKNGKLIEETKCYACHAKKSGFGNGDMIYTRADHKVTSYSRLKTMVATCNSELRLDLFPEDEADVVQYLNQQFYQFKNN
jgi:hypothetical protein